ncbi:hypothetical protein F5Y08DRAFT_349009 [Xylaria arbuscula]|nr:hypothetical protein F5Y08DRAFT_349009 [Xylaria arbuscula]
MRADSSSSSKWTKGKDASKKSHAARNPSTSSNIPPGPRLSFLFVVNELHLHSTARVITNEHGVEMPPIASFQYIGESSGTVFRWCDGVISAARDYTWDRDNVDPDSDLQPSGSIYLIPRNGRPARFDMTKYSQYTIFHNYGSVPVSYMEDDPLCTRAIPCAFDADSLPEGRRLRPMNFAPPEVGITEISASGGCPVVAGFGQPSWMPSLVPEVHRNIDPRVGRSRGLEDRGGWGGLIPVVIGQMALTQLPGQTDAPFACQWWHHKYWIGQSLRSTVSRPGEVRAVVVHVALDDVENQEGSTREALDDLQAGVLVKENIQELCRRTPIH